jgi:hypothetical protein
VREAFFDMSERPDNGERVVPIANASGRNLPS